MKSKETFNKSKMTTLGKASHIPQQKHNHKDKARLRLWSEFNIHSSLTPANVWNQIPTKQRTRL